jgi:hypothetical protein
MFEATALVESVGFIGRLASRRGLYNRALELSRDTGKPVVVVGARTSAVKGWGPVSNVSMGSLAQYECGEHGCVDLGGCVDCGAPPRDVQVVGSIPVRDGGAVVFVSHTLEYVDDPDRAWAEITRAAGGPSHVFVSRNQPWATWTRVATGARWQIDSAPPDRFPAGHARAGELMPFSYHAVRRAPVELAGTGRRK